MGEIRPSGKRSANAKANKYTLRADTSIKLAVDRTIDLAEQCSAGLRNNNILDVKGEFRNVFTCIDSRFIFLSAFLLTFDYRGSFDWLNWVGNPSCHPDSAPPELAGKIGALRGNYMFDIDAANFGNFTRFMNHECYSDKVGIQLLYGNRKGAKSFYRLNLEYRPFLGRNYLIKLTFAPIIVRIKDCRW